eukprot:354533-Chlamydomonas_euryale.AAC.6
MPARPALEPDRRIPFPAKARQARRIGARRKGARRRLSLSTVSTCVRSPTQSGNACGPRRIMLAVWPVLCARPKPSTTAAMLAAKTAPAAAAAAAGRRAAPAPGSRPAIVARSRQVRATLLRFAAADGKCMRLSTKGRPNVDGGGGGRRLRSPLRLCHLGALQLLLREIDSPADAAALGRGGMERRRGRHRVHRRRAVLHRGRSPVNWIRSMLSRDLGEQWHAIEAVVAGLRALVPPANAPSPPCARRSHAA